VPAPGARWAAAVGARHAVPLAGEAARAEARAPQNANTTKKTARKKTRGENSHGKTTAGRSSCELIDLILNRGHLGYLCPNSKHRLLIGSLRTQSHWPLATGHLTPPPHAKPQGLSLSHAQAQDTRPGDRAPERTKASGAYGEQQIEVTGATDLHGIN
jgi:hypothetical protein